VLIGLKQKSDFLGSKLTIALTVATIFVTKPFIHAGFNGRDKEKVKHFPVWAPGVAVVSPGIL